MADLSNIGHGLAGWLRAQERPHLLALGHSILLIALAEYIYFTNWDVRNLLGVLIVAVLGLGLGWLITAAVIWLIVVGGVVAIAIGLIAALFWVLAQIVGFLASVEF